MVFTNADGDQPGVIMNLYRFVRGLGVRPVLCGNIKGLQDPYRTPDDAGGVCPEWGQNPMMVTSFADGTKISFEQAIVANATGMRVAPARNVWSDGRPRHTDHRGRKWYPHDALLPAVRASSTTSSAHRQARECLSSASTIIRGSSTT